MSCFWGHKWETKKVFPCKCKQGNLFGEVRHNVPAETVFQECSKCHAVRCYLTDGEDSTDKDAGFMARRIMQEVQSAANDPFMREVAKL